MTNCTEIRYKLGLGMWDTHNNFLQHKKYLHKVFTNSSTYTEQLKIENDYD